MADSTRKKVLDSLLKAVLASCEAHWTTKGVGTFISELSARFSDLPADQQAAFAELSREELRQMVSQIGITTRHSADIASGVDHVKDQLDELESIVTEIRDLAVQSELAVLKRENQELRDRVDAKDETARLREGISQLAEEATELLAQLKAAFASDSNGVGRAKNAERTAAEQAIEKWFQTTLPRLESLRRGWGLHFSSIGNPTQREMDIGRGQCHESAGKLQLHRGKLIELLGRLDK